MEGWKGCPIRLIFNIIANIFLCKLKFYIRLESRFLPAGCLTAHIGPPGG